MCQRTKFVGDIMVKILRKCRHLSLRCCYLRTKVLVTGLVMTAVFLFVTNENQVSIAVTPLIVVGNVTKGRRIDVSINNKSRSVVLYDVTSQNYVTSEYTTQGENAAMYIKKTCGRLEETKYSSQESKITIRWNKNRDLLFCPIYKVATTFWRRIFMLDGLTQYKAQVNPFVIPFDRELPASKMDVKANNTGVYKFMFSREPYTRLLSFYIDKLVAPNPLFWKEVGVKAIKLSQKANPPNMCGQGVTFPEFIRYVIHTLKIRKGVDPHWVLMTDNCRPCDVQYDFVGSMEMFPQDSGDILRKMNLHSTSEFLYDNGANESDIDAIKDTLSQPFKFYSGYRRCMSFNEAVLRAWTKLQLRGLIGEHPAPRLINMSMRGLNNLLQKAIGSRNDSTKATRRNLKVDAIHEYWKQVDVEDLYSLRQLYQKDFTLFRYDPEPSQIFQGRGLYNRTQTLPSVKTR